MIRTIRIVFLWVLVVLALPVFSQRKMEVLNRGLVAVKVQPGVFLSWRTLGYEWNGVTYNVFRNGVKLNPEPLSISNYTDLTGTISSAYTVTAILDGVEQEHCTPVTPWAQQYKEIQLKPRNTSIYEINDATTADLDGDGAYEIIVKRIAKGWNEDNTNYSYFEAYKLDGTFLWEINVGPNILPDVEINIAAFDFDEDGKAEVFMRTSEGTIFGDGTQIADTDNDGKTNYRYTVGTTANMQYMNAGPEFLSLIDGMTGAELDRVNFIPRGQSSDWGDSYGHRASKYFFGAPYLDGVKPSLFIGRGIYTKTIMRTYDVVNKKLVFRWEFNSGNSGPYFGQGNHNYTIADVDGDGRDEIAWGSMTVDDNGKGLYSTDMGHGDAMHVGDLDPYRKGTEIFKCLEEAPNHGTILYDGATGEILNHHYTTSDCGRCCAANISDDIKGKALWGGNKMFSSSTLQAVGNGGGPENYRIYWDGDLLEEMTDHSDFTTGKGYGTGAIFKYINGSAQPVLLANGATSCNYTKGTPSLQADLFGDWREEVIWRKEDNTAIRIYTTVAPTIYRNYTLMHDHQYRQAICWQMCGYNQPPHVSYFLGEGEGITVPPPPVLSNNKAVYSGTGNWDKSTLAWKKDGVQATFVNNDEVLFDVSAGMNVSITLSENVNAKSLTINSPGNYILNASNAALGGNMMLVKQGAGTFSMNGNHTYSGETQLWGGLLRFNGTLQNSKVWLGFHAEMEATGSLMSGLTMRYGSKLNIGNTDSVASLLVSQSVVIEEGATVVFDIHSMPSYKTDSLIINGNFTFADYTIVQINPHFANGDTKLAPGKYFLAQATGTVSGNLDKIVIQGITGTPSNLKIENNTIYLEVKAVRSAASVVWNGDKPGTVWDLALTDNFKNNGIADIFVANDAVTFNATATSKTVNILGEVTPSSILVEGSENFTFQGTGSISGPATLTKTGTGTLTINNTNTLTGKILLSEGTLVVSKMPTNQAVGPIGPASSVATNLELNGGSLSITGETNSDRALFVGSYGGTLHNTAKVLWYEAITGGILTKTGSGNLILAGANTHSRTILKEGTLTLQNDETNPGKTIQIEGGTLQCSDNMYSYNTISWNIQVPEGKSGAIRLDSRGYYTGSLSGLGTLNAYIPNVRTDFNGDMSLYNGTINFFSSTGNSVELRLNHSKGLPKSLVVVNSNVSTSNVSGTSLILGALAGNGRLDGSEAYEIGAKGIDSEFKGVISAGSVSKVGNGEFKLSNANTYTGGTALRGGKLNVNNTTGSATGSGSVSVLNNATLTGTGIITGIVNVESGGTIAPGSSSTGTKINIKNNVTFKAGSNYAVKVNAIFKLSDRIVSTGKVTVDGNLKITNTTTNNFVVGDSYKIFEAAEVAGSFATISPETPGDGLLWDVSLLNSTGVIKVKADPSYVKSSDATLASLSIAEGAIAPTFSADVTNYTISFPTGTTSATILATANHVKAAVAGSGSVTFDAAGKTFHVDVTAEDGTKKTYSIAIGVTAEAKSGDATLAALSVTEGYISPAFSANVLNYTLTLPAGSTSATIFATANHSKATVTGAGSITFGADGKTVQVVVIAEDGTTKAYSVQITILVGVDAIRNSGIKIYPNPTTAKLFVSGVEKSDKIIVLNAAGQVLVNRLADGDKVAIEVVKFQKGVYVLRVEGRNGIAMIKFVKN